MRDDQNIRFSFSKTIARPSFKELSYAQILDPVSNRIFNGSFFKYNDENGNVVWDGKLKETHINNLDLRWEFFLNRGQLFSASVFYKTFNGIKSGDDVLIYKRLCADHPYYNGEVYPKI